MTSQAVFNQSPHMSNTHSVFSHVSSEGSRERGKGLNALESSEAEGQGVPPGHFLKGDAESRVSPSPKFCSSPEFCNPEYNASSIKIKTVMDDGWFRIKDVAEKHGLDMKHVSRAYEACSLAGVSFDYYVNRYVLKQPVPFNPLVDEIMRDILDGR